MNILAIVGSLRRDGNTDRLVQMLKTELERLCDQSKETLSFETVRLGDFNIRSCRGCRICFDRGEEKCPLRDDISAIKAKMDAADGLLLASPVYVDDVSGLVKTWMDRLAYVCHRPSFGGKCAYTLATVGNSPTSHTLRTMNGALLTWGYHLAGQSGEKMGAGLSQDEVLSFQPNAAKAAAALFRAVSRREALQPTFLSLLVFKIQQLAWQREPADSYDGAYWRNQGWLAPNYTFYVPHRANRLKIMIARAFGAVVAKFMI